MYLGPMKATVDEEGHFFPRGIPIVACTDTAAKLRAAPCAASFAVTDGSESLLDVADAPGGCEPGSGCC